MGRHALPFQKEVAAFLTTLLLCLSANAKVFKASLYAIGETASTPLFTQETERSEVDGLVVWSSVIKDQTGAVAMTEKGKIKDGKVISQLIDHFQINERYELELKNDKVIFRTFKLADGKAELSKTSEREAPAEYLMGPSTEMYVGKHIVDFATKKSRKIDFGVFELGRFVGFKFIGMSVDGDKVEIKMKPSNFIIAALVDPIKIVMDKSKRKIIYLKGRTPLRHTKNGKTKLFDAEIIYH